MKCAECNLWWKDKWSVCPSCHADPDWPAPCEYEEEDFEEDYYTYEDLGSNWY